MNLTRLTGSVKGYNIVFHASLNSFCEDSTVVKTLLPPRVREGNIFVLSVCLSYECLDIATSFLVVRLDHI